MLNQGRVGSAQAEVCAEMAHHRAVAPRLMLTDPRRGGGAARPPPLAVPPAARRTAGAAARPGPMWRRGCVTPDAPRDAAAVRPGRRRTDAHAGGAGPTTVTRLSESPRRRVVRAADSGTASDSDADA